jgi:predicted nucleic acid-binding Zn ribbon protein
MSKKREPIRLGSVMGDLLRERGYLTPCREAEVLHLWPQIVGEKLASMTECTRVENGTLFVRVFSSSWRQEISFMKEHIIERIKRETRCKTITEIVFH